MKLRSMSTGGKKAVALICCVAGGIVAFGAGLALVGIVQLIFGNSATSTGVVGGTLTGAVKGVLIGLSLAAAYGMAAWCNRRVRSFLGLTDKDYEKEWVIKGIDKETGYETEWVCIANSWPDANTKAQARGIRVQNCYVKKK